MLTEFHLKNFVLVESSSLSFCEGFNIISGETGAGKSLLATALSIAIGNTRFTSSYIRKGSEAASLTAVFELSKKNIKKLEAELDIDLSDANEEGLIIERQMNKSGKGRNSICGRPTTLTNIKKLGEHLCDITAQDEHTTLREPSSQRDILDSFASLEKEKNDTATKYRRLKNLVDRLEGGETARKKRQQEIEFVSHYIDELEAIAPDTEEDLKLSERIAFLENASRLSEFSLSGVETLYESDSSASTIIGNLLHEADSLSEQIGGIKNIATSLNDAIAAIDDAVSEMRTLADRAEANPDEQEELILRQNALRDIANKHDCDVSELSAKLEELKKTLDELLEFENEDADLMPKIIEAGQDFYNSATALRELRNKGGRKLSKEIKKHLSKLGMENADFEIKIIALEKTEEDYKELAKIGSENGLDEICFAIRPNKGENWGSITETASGGETTRTMLAIKCAAAKVNPCELQIFDEIDAGVGGRLGEAIANQLEELSKHRQVITITHLPQIAAKGENHLCVKKVTIKNRTTTTVTKLEDEERVTEIAEMIRGSKSNETTLSQAREMIGHDK